MNRNVLPVVIGLQLLSTPSTSDTSASSPSQSPDKGDIRARGVRGNNNGEDEATKMQYMEYRVHVIGLQTISRKIGNLIKYLVTMDVYFFVTWVILLVVSLMFGVEFVWYLLVKLLVLGVERIATPLHVRKVKREMLFSSSLEAYNELALKLDSMTGRQEWKDNTQSSEYDWVLLNQKTKELRESRRNLDVGATVDLLRNSVEVQFFTSGAGALDESMYSRSYYGTKKIIELFVEEVQTSIEFVTENYCRIGMPSTPDDQSATASAEFFLTSQTSYQETPQTRWTPQIASATCGSTSGTIKSQQAVKLQIAIHQIRCQWGHTALVLSGGASLGWHHFGVAETLLKEELLPRIVCGTSAGSAVAAWLCTRERSQLLSELHPSYLVDTFTVLVPASWRERTANFLRRGYACDIHHWQSKTYSFFGSITFLESFSKTGRILNVTLTRADRDEFQILNYKTAPNVLVASAVVASCSCPGLGPSFHLLEKNSNGRLINSEMFSGQYFHDGSIKGDIPISQIKEMWGVRFAIVSQVNPHIFPFSGLRAHGEAGTPVAWRGGKRTEGWRGGFLLSFLEVVLKEHLRFLLRLIVVLRIAPNFGGVNFGNLFQASYHLVHSTLLHTTAAY
eukprot:Lankesteria_metandrocarpae@DN4827_c1_g1_i3.p1